MIDEIIQSSHFTNITIDTKTGHNEFLKKWKIKIYNEAIIFTKRKPFINKSVKIQNKYQERKSNVRYPRVQQTNFFFSILYW